jgi:Pyruvate/2-oxoacid:ferredoxin oxidoreductase delta subunit
MGLTSKELMDIAWEKRQNKLRNNKKPKINTSKCIACELCMEYCDNDAIIINPRTGKAQILYNKCNNCRKCIDKCPLKCIS